MDVKDLIGRKVWVKRRGMSRISSIPRMESTFAASTFRIDLPSGDVLETAGVNVVMIDQKGADEAHGTMRPHESCADDG